MDHGLAAKLKLPCHVRHKAALPGLVADLSCVPHPNTQTLFVCLPRCVCPAGLAAPTPALSPSPPWPTALHWTPPWPALRPQGPACRTAAAPAALACAPSPPARRSAALARLLTAPMRRTRQRHHPHSAAAASMEATRASSSTAGPERMVGLGFCPVCGESRTQLE